MVIYTISCAGLVLPSINDARDTPLNHTYNELPVWISVASCDSWGSATRWLKTQLWSGDLPISKIWWQAIDPLGPQSTRPSYCSYLVCPMPQYFSAGVTLSRCDRSSNKGWYISSTSQHWPCVALYFDQHCAWSHWYSLATCSHRCSNVRFTCRIQNDVSKYWWGYSWPTQCPQHVSWNDVNTLRLLRNLSCLARVASA